MTLISKGFKNIRAVVYGPGAIDIVVRPSETLLGHGKVNSVGADVRMVRFWHTPQALSNEYFTVLQLQLLAFCTVGPV